MLPPPPVSRILPRVLLQLPPPPAKAIEAEMSTAPTKADSKRPVPKPAATSRTKKRSARQDGFKSATTVDSSEEEAVPPKKRSKTEQNKYHKGADTQDEVDELEDSEEEPEARKLERKSKGKGKGKAVSESEPSKLGLIVWVSKQFVLLFIPTSNRFYRIRLVSGARPSQTSAAARSAHPTRYATSATVARSAAPAARNMDSRCPPSPNSLSAARSTSPSSRDRIPPPSPPIRNSPPPPRPSLRSRPSQPSTAASSSRRKSRPYSTLSRVPVPASMNSAPSPPPSPTSRKASTN